MRKFLFGSAFWAGMLGLLSFHSAVAQESRAVGELLEGRYVGWIKFEAAKERIAVVTDIYQESPEDFTKSPSRNAIFKLSLGGYNTHEYLTEIFKDIHSDFDNGTLTLDEPDNDLLITAEVRANGSAPLIVGDVFIRSSSVRGKLYLKFETDEPEDPPSDAPGTAPESSPFIPLLEGQYVGLCNGGEAALQIQTVRGVRASPSVAKEHYGLGSEYGIVARLSGSSPDVCGTLPEGIWCNNFNYSSVTYNFYEGKLILKGPRSSDNCEIHQGEIRCRVQVQGGARVCNLKKVGNSIRGPRFYNRRFHLNPSASQTEALPAAAPPRNADLTAALRGTFSGYLHNETNDTYQVVQLNVVPYSTTNNPHNLNQMAITTTTSAFFGGAAVGSYSSQRFEPRSFYLRPGFTLSAHRSDAFVTIEGWQRGFIRGTWYSHGFGRVGTVELVSGPLPAAPPGTLLLRNFAGQYEGAGAVTSAVKRWIELLFPAQPNLAEKNVIEFEGSQQAIVGLTAVETIESGAFDPYTGRFGWVYSRGGTGTFISAYLDPSDQLKIYWPPAPDVFGALMADFDFETYQRIKLPPSEGRRP